MSAEFAFEGRESEGGDRREIDRERERERERQRERERERERELVLLFCCYFLFCMVFFCWFIFAFAKSKCTQTLVCKLYECSFFDTVFSNDKE